MLSLDLQGVKYISFGVGQQLMDFGVRHEP